MKTYRPRKAKFTIIFSILGLILVILSVLGVIFWETSGREIFLYKNVSVLNVSVEEGTEIEEGMVEKLRIDPSSFIEGSITKEDDVIGKIAKQYIPKSSQLNSNFFVSEKDIKKEANKFIFTIPEDWIITFPGSIRKGDIVYLYPVMIYEEEDIIKDSRPFKEEDIINTEVAYLKDSGNREVIDTGEERFDASANISKIEVMLDYSDFLKIQELSEDNYKFIILYKSEL